jgi:isopenicillin N synthase-like dioxygenase
LPYYTLCINIPFSLIDFSREVLEQIFAYFTRLGVLIESILSQCLGLPSNFLKEFNHDRSWDLLAALHYFPATETENSGNSEHEDGNCITFVFQDEAGGLEVRRNGKWIPVIPTRGSLVVNVGDVIQVKYIFIFHLLY